MPTLLLTPRYTEDSRVLRKAAVAAGWDCVRLANWRIPDWVADRDLVFYGEPLLAEVVAEHLPTVLLEPPLDWLSTLPTRYAQRTIELTTLAEARQHRTRAFFKPAGNKAFPAGVRDAGQQLPGPEVQPDDLPVLVQEPVTWELEVRCFVLERHVVASSPYLRHGELVQTAEGDWPADADEMAAALDFAATVLADPAVLVPPAVVLDVGMLAGRGWAMIEANSAWASGLYGCDPTAVLPVLARASVSRAALTPAVRRWVRPCGGSPL